MKCGFEWHFQLNTRKLFCEDISEISEEVVGKIRRKFNLSISEFEEIDESAKFEIKKSREVIYEICKNDCLVDVDEEPPHEINKEALQLALNIATALNCKTFDKIIVMRKNIVDGSVPSGFQRTILIGIDGYYNFKDKKIPISTVCLEEDAGRKVGEEDGKPIYRLDRLGIPLVEVSTKPIETTPEEAKELATSFGLFTRLFNVRRGIGTIRQDVNLSTEKSNRVEIKGFQNLRKMDKIIKEEINRHENLIKLAQEKGDLIKYLNNEIYDITNLFAETQSKIVSEGIKKGKRVYAMKLPNFSGVLGFKVQTNKRFGGEIGDYLKALYNVSIIHSDELPSYGITENDKQKIKEFLKCEDKDAFLFFITDSKEKEIGHAIMERINTLLKEVPSEVRFVDENSETTKFLRPIGGKERMYIETDLPIIEIPKEMKEIAEKYRNLSVESIAKKLDTTLEKLEVIVEEGKLGIALDLHEKGINTDDFIRVFIEGYNFAKNKFGKEIDKNDLIKLAYLLKDRKIAKEAIRVILEKMIEEGKPIEEIIKEYNLWKMEEDKLKEIVEKMKNLSLDRIIMTIRSKYGPVVDAEDIARILKNLNE
ncbi:MAG: Glu-tRNA(Gln) amidotransferase subunit GatE [Candidatus Rehaiarchaeum fermentans]|nr:Glu-tRNA(Gln) amidotransferase subunit GatE [Candidatus Rehaiarchaeum fermentans]